MLKIARQIIFFVPQLIKGLNFLFVNFSEFITKGGVSINTQFKYKNQNFVFRTIVQPDGDIINFLPPLDKFINDTDWYEQKYETHIAKVRKFLTEMNGLYAIPCTVAGILSFVLLKLSSLYFIDVIDATKVTIYAGWIAVWIILTIIFRKFLCKYLLKTAIIAIKFLINKKLKRVKA